MLVSQRQDGLRQLVTGYSKGLNRAHLEKADALCDRFLAALSISKVPPEQFWAALALRIAQDQGQEIT